MILVDKALYEDIKKELNESFDELIEVTDPTTDTPRTDGYLCKELVNIDINKIRLKTAKLIAILDELNNIEEYNPESDK